MTSIVETSLLRLDERARRQRLGAQILVPELAILAQDLTDAGLDQVEVLVEYQLPLTSRRVDVVLAGVDPRTGDDSFVVIELKQWSRASAHEDSPTLLSVEHTAGPRLHPGVQVSGYCEYLIDFLGVLSHAKTLVRGAAYLHNAVDRDVNDLFARPPTEQSRIFTKQRRGQFLDYLRSNLAAAPGAPAADRFLTSSVRPSRHLLTYAAQELKERSHFTLLDEQRTAYELVMHAVDRARSANTVLHATGSRSFTQTLRKYAGRGSSRLQNLFKYFNSFMAAERNGIDVLICDEAHRIRQTSVNQPVPVLDPRPEQQVHRHVR